MYWLIYIGLLLMVVPFTVALKINDNYLIGSLVFGMGFISFAMDLMYDKIKKIYIELKKKG
jgi:hypothetical protein